MWKRDAQYIEAVRAYISTKSTISAAGSDNFKEGSEHNALLSSFEGLFPAVSKTDACRNLEEHILWEEEKEELNTTPTLEEEEGSGESKPAPPAAAASDNVQHYTSPVLSYVSAVTTDQFTSNNNKRLGIDLSRTVLEITATQPLFLGMAHNKGVRKFVTIGGSDLMSKAPSSTDDSQHQHTAITAPIGDRDGIHRAIRETSSCGYETILATFDDEVLAPTNQQVAAFLFTVTSCLSKNTTSGAYVLLLSGPDHHHLPLHSELLMSKCATFGLNYYVADKGTTTSVPGEDGIATTKSIIVLKLSHRMDAAGPSMACSIPLNQHIEDRQRHGPTPTKDADETDDDYKQRQSTYGQAKREFQRKFLLTSTHPVIPPPCPAVIEEDSYLPVFDVVVQGMGLVEALLVVALARSGKRVLHVCGEGHYGSAFASTDLFSFHRDYIMANTAEAGGLCNLQLFEDNVFTAKTQPATEDDGGQEMTVRITDREKRQFIVDLFPMFHFSRSDLFNLLVDSKVSPNMDMMLVDRVLLLSSKTNEKIASVGDGKEGAEEAVSTTTTPAPPVKMTARERLAKLRQQKEQAAATTTPTSDVTALETVNKKEAATKSTTTTTTHNVSPSSTLAVEPIPFSRADVFRQQSSTKTPPPTNAFARLTAAAAAGSMGLLEMRKLMKFIRDLEKYMSHQAGVRDDGDSGDEDALQAKIGESKEGEDSEDDARRLPWKRSTQDPSEPIATFLGRVYGLSDHTRQLLLLGGAIHNSGSCGTTLSEAVDTLALAFSSVGRFNGLVTPFLVPLYGTGELVQTLCTRSASWLSTTILRRCIRTITPPSPTSNQLTTIELSNGEKVQTKAVVVPNGLLPSKITTTPTTPVPKYHRAILVLSAPLVSWNQLEGLCNDGLAHVDDADQRVQAEEVRASALFPTAVSILPLESATKKNGTDDTTTRSIFIYQLGMSSEHCPYAFQSSGRSDRSDRSVPCLVHFVADASNVTREEFDATVASCTIDDRHHQSGEGVQAGVVPASTHVGILRSSILYRVHFTLDGESSVISGGGGVAGYCRVVDSAAANHGGGTDPHTTSSPSSSSSSQGPIFSISTLFDGRKPETLQRQQSREERSLRATTTPPVVMPPVGGGNSTDPSITQSRGATSVLDDGWYAHTAEAAYHRIHQCLYDINYGCKEKEKNEATAVEEDTEGNTKDTPAAATVTTHYAYMPFFEEFPDPSDRWYAGHQDAEAPKQGSSDEEEEENQNNFEGTPTTTAKDPSQNNSNNVPLGEDSYEDRTLQFLRQQQ